MITNPDHDLSFFQGRILFKVKFMLTKIGSRRHFLFTFLLIWVNKSLNNFKAKLFFLDFVSYLGFCGFFLHIRGNYLM